MIPGYNTEVIKFKGNEIIWTYSWSKSISLDPTKEISHKISGHLFEVCDAFLDDYFNSRNKTNPKYILIPEISHQIQDQILNTIKDKYQQEYVKIIIDNLVFNRPKAIKCKEITITDGTPPDAIIKAETINLILCSNDLWWKGSSRKNPLIRSNPRIENCISKNKIVYSTFHKEFLTDFDPEEFQIKEILPEQIKPIRFEYYRLPDKFQHNLLIYATGNCRSLGDWYNLATETEQKQFLLDFKEATLHFSTSPTNLGHFHQILYVGNNNKDLDVLHKLKECTKIPIIAIPEKDLPLKDFHSKFSTYFYTPLLKNWDCNPRLVQECYKLKKNVFYASQVKETLNQNKPLKYFIEKEKSFG